MKTLKKISICLIISLAVFACVEKDYISFSTHSLYVSENTTTEEKSDNSITPHSDLFEVDVMLTKRIYSFDLKNLSSEKVTIADSFLPQNLSFCIWQPPKVS
jgi:hypothetical protein